MRTEREGELLYTPSQTFKKLKGAIDNGEVESVIGMFAERVEELYLKPAEKLIEEAKKIEKAEENGNKNIGLVFSAGLICVSVIDFLGRFYMGCPQGDVGERFVCWLVEFINPPFNVYKAKRLYKDFRNGLVHECRIKQGGEFSLNTEETVVEKMDDNGAEYLVVNPENLLGEIRKGFKKYLDELGRNERMFDQLVKCLEEDFKKDFRKEG